MKMNRLIFGLLLGTSFLLFSCNEDEPTPLTIATIVAGTVDLNTATAPVGVPVNASITVTFSTDVNTTTATSANITLTQDYDDTDIPMDIQASGKTITLIPNAALGNGALYVLDFGAGLLSTDGLALTPVSRSFTTEGAFAPAGVIAYWNFEDNPNDVVGDYDPATSGIVDITYVASRNAAAGKAVSFNGTTSIIEYANGDALMNTHDFTLSFWVKAMEAGHGHFVIGLGAFHGFQFELQGDFKGFKMPVNFDYGDGTSGTGGDLVYNGDGKTKDNDGWKGTTFSKENAALDATLKEKWAHITYVYNSTSKERMFYLNGELVQKQDHNLWTDDLGQPTKEAGIVGLTYGGVAPEVINELAFGFIQSRAGTLWDTEGWGGYDFPTANHFKGQLDDIRIYHKAITANEVLLMYNSEKP